MFKLHQKNPDNSLSDNALTFLLLLVILLTCLMFITAPSAAAGDDESETIENEYYELTADNISYDYEAGLISARGDVFFARGEFQVRARELDFYIESGDIEAGGDPVRLITPDEEIEGDSLIYNYYRREGELAGARSQIDGITVEGDKIRAVSEKDHRMEVDRTMLTPCLLPDPHYRLEAERILFYPGDRIVAEQVTFYWGDTSLFTLPSYVVEFYEDEETGEMRPVSPSLAYELGYDLQEGFYIELEYPYEIEDLTRGYFFYRDTTGDRREIAAENELLLTDNLKLDSYYERLDDVDEDDEEIHRIEYGTLLTHSPVDYYTTELGYEYEDDEGEIEDRLYGGWRHDISDELEIRQHLSRSRSWQGGEDEREEERPLTTGLLYEPEGRTQQLDLHYDFLSEEWRQEYLHHQELQDDFYAGFYHDYRAGSLERQEYEFGGEPGDHELSIRYRRGYDTEFLPYTDLALDFERGFDLDMGFGRLAENDSEVGQIKLNPSWSGSRQVHSDLELYTDLSYHDIHYSSPADPARFQALETELGAKLELDSNSPPALELEASRSQTFNRGEPYLERDEVDEELLYGLSGKLDIPTADPQSGVELGVSSEYNLTEESWEELRVRLHRYLDCYGYEVSYDFERESFTFGLNFHRFDFDIGL